MDLDRHQLERIADALGLAFYLLMLLAFFTAVTSSAGLAFLLLVLGAAAHVGRLSLEGLLARYGGATRLELRLPEAFSQLRPPPARRRTPSARHRR